MSQHLLTEITNRTYVFKPFQESKLVNHRVKKYQGSNRENNIAPVMVAQTEHPHQSDLNKQEKKQAEQQSGTDKHIDITV